MGGDRTAGRVWAFPPPSGPGAIPDFSATALAAATTASQPAILRWLPGQLDRLFDSNELALNRLTTPVAYLNSLPDDTFADWRGIGFHYFRLDPVAALSLPGVEAILLSLGPASGPGVSSGFTSNTLNLLPYDSTNGTSSEGDIIVTIPENQQSSTLDK